jgi:hypothetical protein
VKFAEHNPRYANGYHSGEAVVQIPLATEICDHNIRVDEKMRFKVLAPTLPAVFIDLLATFLDNPLQFVGLFRR